MKSKSVFAGVSVVLVGFVLGWFILYQGEPVTGRDSEHENQAGHGKKGTVQAIHHLRHLIQNGFEFELGLEEGQKGPAHFLASAYTQAQSLSPEAVHLTLQLQRPGETPEAYVFQPHGQHLRSILPVAEPHIFMVQVTAEYEGKTYQWKYWQVEGGIELQPGAIKEAGIEIKAAGPAPITTTVALPGEVRYNPRQLAHVVPRVAGVVTEVRKFLGDKVEKGDILAVLESRDLADLKSQYLVTLKRLDLAQEIFEREERLWKEKVSAEQDYLVAKKELAEAQVLMEAAAQKLRALDFSRADLRSMGLESEALFSRYELKAPFSGEVVEKHLALGEAVTANAKVYTIADLSTVWGEITVYTKDLNKVRLGQEVLVKAVDMSLTTSGTVFYVGPLVGQQTRSAKAYVEIPNSEGRWRPGLFITVEVVQEKIEVPVAVKAKAVQTYRNRPVVFVQHGNLFEPRPVVLGRGKGQWVEVYQGLSAGERYAASNSFVLKSELGKSAATHQH
ncbi:efflux RND transporter periplasmic adaptor subunit [Nitrosococcus oceani]|uniref:efflux RND transporter periplasmic adaptor subunit n=1 Tax=Nitrosococcus oceani TaxID=1229 RepID=UPI0004E95B54|nr:efflux RND transporter periplasmic adaptor subunit [Nitrosococcus oceani]KFI22895.1 hemolysin D [Nitrosococcus oceani]